MIIHINISFPAVKCNDNLLVIEVLAALGTSFDCASKVNIIKCFFTVRKIKLQKNNYYVSFFFVE